MKTKEDVQERILNGHLRILQTAFAFFYGNENVDFSTLKEDISSKINPQGIYLFGVENASLGIDEEIQGINAKRNKWFEEFLFNAFYECMERNSMLNHDDSEIVNFGKVVYQKACSNYEKYMRKFLNIHIENIIEISSLYYEGAEAKGDIVFFLDSLGKVSLRIKTDEETKADKDIKKVLRDTDVKMIRKMLEISSEELLDDPFALAFSFDKEWEFVGFIDSIPKQGHWIHFHFIKHMVWEMYWNSKCILRYSCGKYTNPEFGYVEEFKRKIGEMIPGFDCGGLWTLVEAAISQKHGTTLVIICEDEETVGRDVKNLLHISSGTALEATTLNAEYVKRLTAIDGALIIDHEGHGYGFGMILVAKGDDTVKRDPGRGARFNSAKLYIADQEALRQKAIAVIVSEDGFVNFYSTNDAGREKSYADRQ